jgi:hypothetical protein
MPAVTVSDITILPRVIEAPGSRARTIKSITTAPQGFEGEGFPVRRAFAGVDMSELDPFIHLDQMGEVVSKLLHTLLMESLITMTTMVAAEQFKMVTHNG